MTDLSMTSAQPVRSRVIGALPALALLLFATFLAHLGAALTHALIFRDGVFQSMASWRS